MISSVYLGTVGNEIIRFVCSIAPFGRRPRFLFKCNAINNCKLCKWRKSHKWIQWVCAYICSLFVFASLFAFHSLTLSSLCVCCVHTERHKDGNLCTLNHTCGWRCVLVDAANVAKLAKLIFWCGAWAIFHENINSSHIITRLVSQHTAVWAFMCLFVFFYPFSLVCMLY